MGIREKFIKLLTVETEDNEFRVFNEDGSPAWGEVTLEMVMQKFDKAMNNM